MIIRRRITLLTVVTGLVVLCLQSVSVATTSSVSLDFNSNSVPGDGRIVWFNSVLTPSYSGTLPVSIYVENASLVLTKSGSPTYTLALPNAQITYSSAITEPSIVFNSASNSWLEQIPWGLPGNSFQDGIAFQVPTGQDLGGYNALWTGDYSASTSGVTIDWKGAASVYKFPITDLSALEVKPVDPLVPTVPIWYNTFPAGTPVFLSSPGLIAAGGTGDGTSYVGSYSQSATVQAIPEPGCVAGAAMVLSSGVCALFPFARRRRR